MKISQINYLRISKYGFDFKGREFSRLFQKNRVFVRKKSNRLILKIRTPRKYPFKRIFFNKLNEELWIGKMNENEDLFFLKMCDEKIIISIIENQRKYEMLLCDLIRSDMKILYNKLV